MFRDARSYFNSLTRNAEAFSQIAALLVNAGLKVKILDIAIDEKDPNKISRKSYEMITDKKRPQLFDLNFAPNLTYGNFEEDLQGEDDADIYIEAVKEELDIKHSVWKQVKAVAKDNALQVRQRQRTSGRSPSLPKKASQTRSGS